MALIKPQKVVQEQKKITKRELYATVCYYYPQYTLKDVEAMTSRDVWLLLEVAHKVRAKDMYAFTQIAAAPHTKDGKGVTGLLDYFKEIGKF